MAKSKHHKTKTGAKKEQGKRWWILVIGLIFLIGVCVFLILWTPWEEDKGDRSQKMSDGEKRMDENTMLYMGSSEFNHGDDTPYHPNQVFNQSDMRPVIVGSAYTQSLFHTVAIAAIEPYMENRRVSLIVSPQWFDKEGVKKEHYTTRFSEANYIAMLLNPRVPSEIKEYIARRTDELLVGQTEQKQRVEEYKVALLKKKARWLEIIKYFGRAKALESKEENSVWTAMEKSKKTFKKRGEEVKQINWLELYKNAEDYGKKTAREENFYIHTEIFERRYKNQYEKGYQKNYSYTTSPEYEDLRMFLQLCKEVKIEVKLIIIPLNGYWCDFSGFSLKNRVEYYENIRRLGKEWNVEVADLSGEEYTPYFMEDSIHIGLKGWVKTNESVYDFFKTPKKIRLEIDEETHKREELYPPTLDTSW